MEAPTCASTGEWIKKPWYMQTMERYSAIKYAFLNYRFSSDYEHNLENTEKSKGRGGGGGTTSIPITVMMFCPSAVFICHMQTQKQLGSFFTLRYFTNFPLSLFF